MENKLEETIETEVLVKPYFITSMDNEKFYVVKSIVHYTKNNLLEYNFDEEIGELILGRDIREENTRGIRLSVEYTPHKQDNFVPTIIEDCRKLASLSLFDYFGFEKFKGCLILMPIPNYAIVQPRLFRKVIDN